MENRIKKSVAISSGDGGLPSLPIILECGQCMDSQVVIMDDWTKGFICQKCQGRMVMKDGTGIPQSSILFRRSLKALEKQDARTAIIELVSSFESFLKGSTWAALISIGVDEDIIDYLLNKGKAEMKNYSDLLSLCITKWAFPDKGVLLKKSNIVKKNKVFFYDKIANITELRNRTIHGDYIPSLLEVRACYPVIKEVESAIQQLIIFLQFKTIKDMAEFHKKLNNVLTQYKQKKANRH